MKTKICNKCKKIFFITEFYRGNDKNNLTYWCKKCYQNYRKEHYQLHKKEILKKMRELYQKYKEELKETAKKYRSKSEVKQYQKEYLIKYKQKPKEIYRGIYHSAKKRNIIINFSKEEFINWYNNQDKKCYYCKRDIKEIIKVEKKHKFYKRFKRLTIDRKDNRKGYVLNNIVLACRRCNSIKGDYFTEQQMLKIGKTIR